MELILTITIDIISFIISIHYAIGAVINTICVCWFFSMVTLYNYLRFDDDDKTSYVVMITQLCR